MELELIPEQPHSVAEALETLVAGPAPVPDPWWQAGLDEALEPSGGAG